MRGYIPYTFVLFFIALFDPVTAYIKVCVENTEEIIVVKEGGLIMKNLIIRFDEDKVFVKETDPKRSFRTV